MSQPPPGPTQKMSIDELNLVTGEAVAAGDGPTAFLHVWFQLFKTAQIHDMENQALKRPIENFIQVLARMVSREGRVSFQAKDRALFLNSVKLKTSTEEFEQVFDCCEFLEERGMGGFALEGGLDTAGVKQLLRVLVYAPPARRKFSLLQEELRASGLPVRINKTLKAGAGSESEVALERRSYTFLTYSKLVVLYRSLVTETNVSAMKRQFLVKKIGRTIHALVDICLEDDHTFLGVSSVKSGEAYAPHHAANTAVLSISLGEKIGLGKVVLADLGLAAVFHDVGLKDLPAEVLQKEGALDGRERAVIEGHPFRGVEFLLAERTLSRSVLTQIVAAYSHHRRFDRTGYPRGKRPLDLVSRIIAITSTYDALTTDRPWRKAYLPDEALGQILAGAGKQFDPLLTKVFVNTMGLYPVGTLVRLTTGELGVVVYGGGEGERATRPVVAVLGADGKPGAGVDLTERDGDGAYRRGIVSAEDPAKYGLRTSGLLSQGPTGV